ncbi:MAG: hypothetical protein ACTSSN_03005 [Candidatus Heimdallarchaeaceae archaeon]
MILDNVENVVNSLKSTNELYENLDILRVYAANEKSEKAIEIVNVVLQKCKEFGDKRMIVNLLELKIKQFFGSTEDLMLIEKDLSVMKQISSEIDYQEGLILAFSIEWGVERFKGNEDKSMKALRKTMDLLEACDTCNKYTFHIARYSYAFNKWIEDHDPRSSDIFEECLKYFYENGFYRSVAQTLGILLVIYQHTYDNKRASRVAKKILLNQNLFKEHPNDIQALSNFFIGFSHKLNYNLELAKESLVEAKDVFKKVYKNSIYSIYYVVTLSQLSTVLALQGDFDGAIRTNEEVEKLISSDSFEDKINPHSKMQVEHSFNLTRFYILTRIEHFDDKEIQELTNTLIEGIKGKYSNPIMLSEFLLNANLSREQLQNLLEHNNVSLKNVNHIILFLIEKTEKKNNDNDHLNYIQILENIERKDSIILVEQAFRDLLIAQQLYSMKQFTEIHSLLKKYKNKVNRLEILEMRVFMEAFIQVGAYKTGDPLAPALQYIAIKKCRQYGFSRLENKLLDYLNMQGKDTFNMISKNS